MTAERRRIAGFCPLCVSRCGCEAVVEDGQLVAIEPDPSHPTGKALCAKGRASPELVEATDRLLYPMRRTRLKGDPDPGWQRITWDEALNETATAMCVELLRKAVRKQWAFAITTTAGTAISDAGPWVDRLINAFGSPNNRNSTEIYAWHRNYGRAFTTGTAIGAPDYERAGCILSLMAANRIQWRAVCHWADGPGGPEIASLAVLPAQHIVQQMADFKSGARTTSVPQRTPPQLMIKTAKNITDAEIGQAAIYFSGLKPRAAIKVVTATVPKTRVAGWFLAALPGGETEPIAGRIIEVPEDPEF
jgi:cytochrome c553